MVSYNKSQLWYTKVFPDVPWFLRSWIYILFSILEKGRGLDDRYLAITPFPCFDYAISEWKGKVPLQKFSTHQWNVEYKNKTDSLLPRCLLMLTAPPFPQSPDSNCFTCTSPCCWWSASTSCYSLGVWCSCVAGVGGLPSVPVPANTAPSGETLHSAAVRQRVTFRPVYGRCPEWDTINWIAAMNIIRSALFALFKVILSYEVWPTLNKIENVSIITFDIK